MLEPHSAAHARLARGWLLLATAAVALSSLFALLIAAARVPGLGALFPGADFYRVALTLHVDLSQWVWFMAFASLLWVLAERRDGIRRQNVSLALAAAGSLLMALSPLLGAAHPVTSNYLPVLNDRWFLGGLVIWAAAVLASAARALLTLRPRRGAAVAGAGCRATKDFFYPALLRHGLWLVALIVCVALLLLLRTARAIGAPDAALPWFETLFWPAGHVWQFALTTLMMLAWLLLCPSLPVPRRRWPAFAALWLHALPALLLPWLLPWPVTSAPFAAAMTALMQWAGWEVPLSLGALLLWQHARGRRVPPLGLCLSLLLLSCGIVLGTQINGQTTLVTAHYHGTIGAVTVAFMAVCHALLPVLGLASASARAVSVQLSLYGFGILLMMGGLAGAGIMGAPRKIAGNVGLAWSVESVSRIALGLGGALATLGIVLFFVLLLRPLRCGGVLRTAAAHGL